LGEYVNWDLSKGKATIDVEHHGDSRVEVGTGDATCDVDSYRGGETPCPVCCFFVSGFAVGSRDDKIRAESSCELDRNLTFALVSTEL